MKKQQKDVITSHDILRWRVFERDNFQCMYCGKTTIEHKIELHIDHVIPKKSNGPDCMENYITACQQCNLSKNKRRLPKEIEKKIFIYLASFSNTPEILIKDNNLPL